MSLPEIIGKFTFKAPFTCIVAGPTGAGKSVIIKKILEENQSIIEPTPDRIVYCLPYKTKEYAYLYLVSPKVEIIEGLPDINMFNDNLNNLLILDDLMTEAEKSDEMMALFTTHSHHKNISVIFTKQNLFSQNAFSRTISLNAQYLILLNNSRDMAQIATLGRQMFPNNSKFLVEAYKEATTQFQYGYLVLDFKQSTKPDQRVQRGIFYDDLNNMGRRVFKPKELKKK